MPIFFGTSGDDSLSGTSAVDSIYGDEGNDTLRGWYGDDLLYGGAGADNLAGGIGNDTLEGGAGADTLRGNDGDDFLFGDAGNDVLFGGAGEDAFFFLNQTFIQPVTQATTIGDFESGVDYVTFGPSFGGNPYVVSLTSVGQNTVLTYAYDFGAKDNTITFRGVTGAELNAAASAGFFEDITWLTPKPVSSAPASAITGTSGDDILSGTSNPERISGLAGNDTIKAWAGNDSTYGGDGADDVAGGDGDDDVFGGNGHDNLKGNDGWDWLGGGAGNDVLAGGTGNDIYDGGEGADTFHFSAVAGVYNADTILDFDVNVDSLSFAAGTLAFLVGNIGTPGELDGGAVIEYLTPDEMTSGVEVVSTVFLRGVDAGDLPTFWS